MDKVIKFRKDRKLNKKKIYIIIAVFVLAIIIATIMVIYNSNKNFRNFMDKYIFRKDVTEENVPTIDIDYKSNTNIFTYGKYITLFSLLILFFKLLASTYNLSNDLSPVTTSLILFINPCIFIILYLFLLLFKITIWLS